jgi:gliding motility-associated-like protein
MRIKILLVSIFILSALIGFSQVGNFISAAGTGGIDECNDIVTGNNRVFSTGYYTEECYFGLHSMPHLGSDDGFVACQNTNGEYIWALGINGPLSDRGMVITRSTDGSIYVGGIFQELLSVENFNITSASNSQDIFIAKIDNDGNVLWLNSYGGSGVETISGIGVSSDNSIWISGQFFGETQFGNAIVGPSSNLLNQTGVLSIDAFLVKLNSSGQVIDGIKIASPENDRLTNIAVDPSGNVILAVQGIQDVHVGDDVVNIGSQTNWVLLKIAGNTDLVWSQRVFSNSLELKAVDVRSNTIALAGEFSSDVAFPDSSSYPILTTQNSNNTFAIFIQNSTSNYIGHFQESSTSSISIEDISFNSFGNLWVTGRFRCTFESMITSNEAGLFNSIGYDDIYVSCYQTNSINQRIYKQHLGSRENDDVNCIFSKGLLNPVFGGSFEEKLYFQKSPSWNSAGSNELNNNNGFCNQANYGTIGSITSYGNKDIFTGSIIDSSLPVLDIYDRSDQESCLKNQVRPIILPSEDSLFSCDPIELMADTNLAEFYKDGYSVRFFRIGNSGSVSFATEPGIYEVRLSTNDGCRVLRDSVYLNVYPNNGPPEIGVLGGNLIQTINPGCENKISKMLGDTLKAYGQSFPGDSLIWRLYPFGQDTSFVLNTNQDTVEVIDGGIYLFTRITPEGCVFSNCLSTSVFGTGNCTAGNAPVEFNFEYFIFGQPLDSITVCKEELVQFTFDDSLNFYTNEFALVSIARWQIEGEGVQFSTVDDNDDPIPPYSSIDHYNFARFTESGWITVKTTVLRPLNYVDTVFHFEKNIYVQIREPEEITFAFTPEKGFMCPGDTLSVSFTISPDDVPYIVKVGNETVDPNTFDFSFFKQSNIRIEIDSVYRRQNCLNPGVFNYPIRFKPSPTIKSNPINGFKCPEEEIALIPNPGTEHVWNGPSYAEYPADTLYTLYPGVYYYRFIDTTGCPLVSKKALVRNINTFLPDAIGHDTICGNMPALIKLDPDSFLIWTWLPPLAGADTNKYIFNEGYYSVAVKNCALADTFNFFVPKGIGSAQLEFIGPSSLCPGDTTYLTANPDADFYQWSTGSFEDTIMITQGTFVTVTVSDSLLCTFTSGNNVIMNINPPEPEFIHIPACPGTAVEVTTDSPHQIHWSIDEESPEIEVGSSITVEVTQNLQLIGGYAQNSTTGCKSEWVGTELLLNSVAVYPTLPENFIFCAGDTIILIPAGSQGISSGVWTGPNQLNEQSFELGISQIQSIQAGVYSFEALVDSGYCTYDEPIFTTLTERFLDEPTISSQDSICAGEQLVMSTFQTSDYNYTWQGPQTNSSGLQHIVSPANTGDSGYYYLTSRDSNCVRTDSVIVFVSAIPPAVPTISSILNICIGDTLFLYNADSLNTVGANISWFGPDVLQTNGDNIAFIPSFQADMVSGLGLQYGINMCLSSITSANLEPQPYPVFAFIYDDVEFCEGGSFQLTAPIEATAYNWSIGSSANSVMVYESDVVYLTVYDEFGCRFTDSVIVEAINCDLDNTPNAFSPNSDGYNDFLSFKVAGGIIYKATIFDRWGKLIKEINGVDYDWDGTNLRGEKVDDGTYFYILAVQMLNGKMEELQGTVNVFR